MELRATPPNLVSLARLLVTPILFVLVLLPTAGTDLAALLLFAAAALSDFVDGWLARRYGWTSELGVHLDPLADRMLIVATFVPFYLVTRDPGALREVPIWETLPLWVLIVVLGREAVVGGLALLAARRDATVPPDRAGKWKSATEDLFSGALLLWWVLRGTVWTPGGPTGGWSRWAAVLEVLVAGLLAVALLLAVISIFTYVPRVRRRL